MMPGALSNTAGGRERISLSDWWWREAVEAPAATDGRVNVAALFFGAEDDVVLLDDECEVRGGDLPD